MDGLVRGGGGAGDAARFTPAGALTAVLGVLTGVFTSQPLFLTTAAAGAGAATAFAWAILTSAGCFLTFLPFGCTRLSFWAVAGANCDALASVAFFSRRSLRSRSFFSCSRCLFSRSSFSFRSAASLASRSAVSLRAFSLFARSIRCFSSCSRFFCSISARSFSSLAFFSSSSLR